MKFCEYLAVLLSDKNSFTVGLASDNSGGGKNVEHFLQFSNKELLSKGKDFPLISGKDLGSNKDKTYLIKGSINLYDNKLSLIPEFLNFFSGKYLGGKLKHFKAELKTKSGKDFFIPFDVMSYPIDHEDFIRIAFFDYFSKKQIL